MSDLPLHAGPGSFVFADPAATLQVFFFCPPSAGRTTRIVIALHGLDRAAAQFRDVLAAPAARTEQIVLVPEFDAAQFPDVHAYNYGNVRRPPPDGTVLPRDRWNFSLVDRLFARVRTAVGADRATFGMFGNSAGAQFVLRYLALTEGAAVDAAVAANSGWYMLPDLALDYPTGLGGLDLDDGQLRRYLGRRLTVLLGDADTDGAAPDLPRGPSAMAQGPHRLARGIWHYEHCKLLADRLGARFGWDLAIVPGARHVDQKIFDRGVGILAPG